ncbi:phosphopantothenoylcysteine decarboxylase/phosphopantothenate/cysteine ligase [Thiorhodococcus drewsii AZ1]|uniref:Coenzyme A biosynthesis bifunctional protein CoaBC n=1 Tax=Thiorhodococcus drewsii AZ1 TaxID=765913 RepID=G2E1F8_9GAMM|nr:bifunctional phosphopantothenoylcysteine decarboxylase/phosphopantothenate--cysteine ligase CoaBC [Thiorhodococcus drewsii]EGV31255.1 phosphopantothenoylcysteine decarboxylase/phosphopantothenate/cysteine ligase [Thiorhodococcus drewsii AZ1]
MNQNRIRRLLLGVGGGIAAYKSVDLVRRLGAQGFEVRVVMTPAATQFVAPLTFQAVSGHPVRIETFDSEAEAGMDHIALARWADLLLIAPATADLMARLAVGMANDLLTTLALACEAPLVLAPAMNQAMWLHPATQDNLRRLVDRGARILGPGEGVQACGEIGPGRMLEPAEIVSALSPPEASSLKGVRVLLTAGPTREPLDPVRFLGNRSSGRMGYALAESLADLGARVVLVSGPTALTGPSVDELVRVETALEMHAAVMSRVVDCDLFVATAAVADYRPERAAEGKIKKSSEELTLRLVRNPDILSEVAASTPAPFTVGFAAETDRVADYALGKLRDKRLDMIAANLVGAERGGFERDENALSVYWSDGSRDLPMMNKTRLAAELAALIAERYRERHVAST